MGVDVDPCKKKKKSKRKEKREKKKVHTAGGGRERADGLCGSVVMWACRWACRRVGMWMRMAVNKKEKRRTQTWRVERVDGPVGVRMGVQLCGHADVDGCKQKGKRKKEKRKRKRKRKKLLIGSEHADGHAKADDCKKRKKRKEKKRLTGVPSGRMGVWTCCGWACVDALAGGREWL